MTAVSAWVGLQAYLWRMMNDIANRQDIALLVDRFYGKVRVDELLGPIFNDVAQVDWDEHLETLTNFWNTVLMGEAGYKGNPMLVHILLNKKVPLAGKHFDHWLAMFRATIDELFAGEKADTIKEKAAMMAQLIQYKVEQSGKPGFLA
jgi:Truncated hemoglobins